ncbi:hypothetical protein IB243_06750 [Acidovorax sp. ACV01]|nr:hypothetical protein [Acidovorax sp. ACV01]
MNGAPLFHWLVWSCADAVARASRCGAVVLFALLLASTAARAAGPVGPVGPVGPIGPVGVEPVEAPRKSRANPVPRPAAPAQPSGSAASGAPIGNRIEVSGNTASGTRCAADGTASVNSVDVSGARLDGRTVIVQGRNASDVRTSDCPARAEQLPQGHGATGQTNSIRVR